MEMGNVDTEIQVGAMKTQIVMIRGRNGHALLYRQRFLGFLWFSQWYTVMSAGITSWSKEEAAEIMAYATDNGVILKKHSREAMPILAAGDD